MIVSRASIAGRVAPEAGARWWRSVPPWAEARVAGAAGREEAITLESGHILGVRSRDSAHWSILTAILSVGPEDNFDHLARLVYQALISRLGGRSPARFWNFIPSIHREAGKGLDRYRAFNVGRHAALLAWSGATGDLAGLLPTATGVGHLGTELAVHCLATTQAPINVENPRQRPAYRYSRRFGPVSPSFARATILPHDGGTELLIGGTSSVRGEESLHPGNAMAQLEETIANLRALIGGVADHPDPLSLLESVRVYYVRPDDAEALRERVTGLIPHRRAEFIRADICREELLVEIEGVAAFGAGPDGRLRQ